MPNENPWAYNEANNRIHETAEKEKVIIEQKKEDFEKNKERVRKKKTLDVFGLKRKIETTQSLEGLKDSIRQAFREGAISKDAFEKTMETLNQDVSNKNIPKYHLDPQKLPFSQNEFAKMLEEASLGENVFVDITGVFYGFFVQGSAIMVILAWKIFTDLLFLPKDVYQEFIKN